MKRSINRGTSWASWLLVIQIIVCLRFLVDVFPLFNVKASPVFLQRPKEGEQKRRVKRRINSRASWLPVLQISVSLRSLVYFFSNPKSRHLRGFFGRDVKKSIKSWRDEITRVLVDCLFLIKLLALDPWYVPFPCLRLCISGFFERDDKKGKRREG